MATHFAATLAVLVALVEATLCSRPNVLFIVVDDLSPAIAPYGGLAITPNLERLAQKSTQFQRAYVSVAICGPSRTAFLTGLRPDTTQVWTIGPYFRNTSRGQGLDVVTLPQLFRTQGYNVTGAGKIFHPGYPSGGLIKSEGGGDQCPAQSATNDCTRRPTLTEPGSWTEPYWFCDQYTNDTVQSPAMQQWPCAVHGAVRSPNATYSWPSCGGGCVQDQACIDCFSSCGTWGQSGAWDDCDCPDRCYPEGLIADQTIRVLKEKASDAAHRDQPWFHAMGLKRPHLSYRAPLKYFDMYDASKIPLPLHRRPSPTAPPISYSHTCQVDSHSTSDDERVAQLHAGAAVFNTAELFEAKQASPCKLEVLNRTINEFNHTAISFVEINTDDQSVRDLRRAYYAVISFMDSQLGRVLDALDEFGLANNTIVTFIGDHGYQNGEKGEWCKSNNFELATRIPMYVSVPSSLGTFARGVVETTPVESLDLFPTLAQLADLELPPMALGGESLVALLSGPKTVPRKKTWALSQWPRRPSCTTSHQCMDGGGNPWHSNAGDGSLMGYTIRDELWRYTAWVGFNWGEGGDPRGDATTPKWEEVSALELYDHRGDTGDYESGEKFEWQNLAYDDAHQEVVKKMHQLLVKAVETGLVKPMLN